MAVIKQNEKTKQKAFEIAAKEPMQQTFETNPLAQSNEQLFRKASGTSKKKRRKAEQDKFTNDM